MRARLCVLLLTGFLIGGGPAAAQYENIDTVEGPGVGESTTLTVTPHELMEGLSVRALGIAGSDTTRWALRFIGLEEDPAIHITYGGDSLRVLSIEQPGPDEVGPTTVYVDRDAFLTMAELGTVTLTVGNRRTSLPEALRQEMRKIFERVTG